MVIWMSDWLDIVGQFDFWFDRFFVFRLTEILIHGAVSFINIFLEFSGNFLVIKSLLGDKVKLFNSGIFGVTILAN